MYLVLARRQPQRLRHVAVDGVVDQHHQQRELIVGASAEPPVRGEQPRRAVAIAAEHVDERGTVARIHAGSTGQCGARKLVAAGCRSDQENTGARWSVEHQPEPPRTTLLCF